MCGLAGELRLDGARADLAAVERMAATMADRGPDGAGSWSHGPVALAHRRLSIIDLSDASAQPLVDPVTGLTCVFNGCIYNYRQLRADLQARGHTFVSTGDSEVVLKAYAEWGSGFVEKLFGMFAFALFDRRRRRVLFARDRLGIKPLYLTESARTVRFASTLPALLAGGGVDTSLDTVALAHYLSFHAVVPPPRTILTGVRKLPPATVRLYEPDGRTLEHTYWTPAFRRSPERAGWSSQDWQDALLASLTVAVHRRMVADVPVGVLLSGGLDSSLVVALLAEQGQRGLATFSIGFDSVGGRTGHEFAYSDIVAQHFGTDHHQIRVEAVDLVSPLERCVEAMAEPMVSHDCVAFYLLSEAVSKHVKVVQSGQGADEVLGGYHWYPPLVGTSDAVGSYAGAFFDRDAAGLAEVLSPDYLAGGDPAGEFVRAHFARPGAEPGVDQALRLDTMVMLADDPVKRVDSMTMAHGLEARVPFLDHEFVELAATCPPELKLAQGGKGVLKDVGRRVLPVEVVDRPKGYFPVPGLTHLEGPVLARVRDALHDPAARRRGLFRTAYVDTLLADPNADLTPLQGNKLWQLGLLEMWLQTHGIS